MNHATAPLAAIDEALKATRIDPNCEGPGKCHGCLSWCNTCGDVGAVCDDRGRCHSHAPCDVCGRPWRMCESGTPQECAELSKREEDALLNKALGHIGIRRGAP